MGNWASALLGLLLPPVGDTHDTPPPAQPLQLVPAGHKAAELCMIPTDWRDLDAAADQERLSGVRDVRLVQLKADGINAVALPTMIVGGRDGAPLNCALQCQPALRRVEKALGAPHVLFGEYVANDGFNATLSEHRKGIGDGVFWLYDAVPYDAWASGHEYRVPIEERLERLRAAFHSTDTGLFVGFLDFWLLDAGELRTKAHEVWAAGFEGLVSKRLGSGFVRERSRDWRKVKIRYRQTCAVVDTMHRDGKLRSIIVRPWQGSGWGGRATGTKPITLTGGWSDEEAQSIDIGMADGSEGRLVDVEFDLTVGTTRTIRSPKFKGLIA